MTHRLFLTLALALGSAGACNCSATGSLPAQHPASDAPSRAEGQDRAEGATPPGTDPTEGSGVALPKAPPSDPRVPLIAAAVTHLLQTQHLKAREIDPEMAARAFDFYIEQLDPAKLFLLKPQVEALRARAKNLEAQIAAGDLQLAGIGTALLTEQRNKVAKMVARLTEKPFDLSDQETFETDPEKRDFAQNDSELEDLWRRNLELQALERITRMRRALEEREKAEAEGAADGKGEDTAAAKGAGKQPHKGGTRRDKDEAKVAAAGKDEEPPPKTDAEREEKARAELATAYAGRFQRRATPEPLEAVETFLNAVAAVYGPHTLFMAPDEKANFDIHMTGSLEGIGAVLSEDDHYIEVREVVPGGAAWRQGELEAGDLIQSVAQQDEDPVDVTDMRLSDVVKMIRGPKGTIVSLNVRKPDGRVTTVVITRDVIVVEASYARGALLKLDAKDKPVGYIYLPSFYGDTRGHSAAARDATEDVRALLQRFSQRKVDAVILDLRGNGGGLLSAATGISGLFIEQGPVVQVRRSDGEAAVLRDKDPSIAFRGRVVVMVDRFSASASEIVAGALQDYHRALVVGTSATHGKGTVQVLADLDQMVARKPGPLGVLKLTTQQFFLVDGESTQQRGVQPDILLPDPLSYVESGERFLDNPVPWSKVEPLPHQDWNGASWDVATLAARTQARVDKSPIFERIVARANLLKQRSEDTLLPLQQASWDARVESQEKALEALERDPEDEPKLLTVEPVSYRAKKDDAQAEAEAAKAAAERIENWRKQLERDPWVEQSVELFREAG